MFGLLVLIKGVAVVCSMAFALPIGGVYASADSPSKYLDRLTTVNTSMNRESNDASPGVEDEPTVSRAVRASHGVILNTVVRNANRLEYVNDSPVTIEGNDDGTELIGEKAVARNTGTSDSNEHTVNLANTNASGDGQSRGIEWPEEGFTGESTVTYDANGKGAFADGATTNAVTTKYTNYMKPMGITKYAHSNNVNDDGVQSGGYGDNQSSFSAVSIEGATSLKVDLTYQTESTNYDWVCAYPGYYAGNSQCTIDSSRPITDKLGGTTKRTTSFTVDGNAVTFQFHSDSSISNYYGYYAVITGMSGTSQNLQGEYQDPLDPDGEYQITGWNSKPDGSGEDLGYDNIHSPVDITAYAQWEPISWNRWNTVKWAITYTGLLMIRPLTGDSGVTGNVTNESDVPWHSSRSSIKNVRTTGNIILHSRSPYLFEGTNLTNTSGLANLDVSKVQYMHHMFYGCYDLTDLTGLSNWNTSNVRDVSGMFRYCHDLTDLTGLSNWDTSKIWFLDYMFADCRGLTDLTALTHWDVSNVTGIWEMFYDCYNLTDLTGLANWNVSNVTDMNNMFYNCYNLTDLKGLANWDVSNVTSMYGMFYNCDGLTNLTGLENWNTSKLKWMSYGTKFSDDNYAAASGMFSYCDNLQDLTALSDWDVSQVEDMTYLFFYCRKLKDLTPLSKWNVSNAVNIGGVFSGCSELTSLHGLENWDFHHLTSLSVSDLVDGGAFSGCTNLENISALEKWNVENVTNLSAVFYNCDNLTDIGPIGEWNVSKVTEMYSVFRECSGLTDLTPLKKWDMSNVLYMNNMFLDCSKLIDLNGIVNWNVSNVTNMHHMFANCVDLIDISALSEWDIGKVTDMSDMFLNCGKLARIGVPSIANNGALFLNYNKQAFSIPMPKLIEEGGSKHYDSWGELLNEMQTSPNAYSTGMIYVKYEPSWIIEFNPNGGVGSQNNMTMPIDIPSVEIPNTSFLRFGYRFTGWTTQPDPVSDVNPLMLPGTTYKPDNPVDGKKYNLYAQWEKIGGSEDQPVTGQSGAIPGWVQVGSENTRNDILPNQSQSVVFTNKYDPGLTSIQFRFTKLMDGNVPDSSESFQFELFSVSENKAIQTTVNNGASVQFEPITYDKTGEYVYYVRESPSNPQDNVNSNPSIDYDDHLVEVKVTVTDENDPDSPSGKKLTATAQITGDTTFRNDSKPASLDISKNVTGVTEDMNDNHRDREFTFNVNLLDRDNQPVTGKTYPTTITNNSGSGESSENTSSSTSSITFDATGNATIKLKAGSKLTINGIPAYYKYTITETNIPAGYENTSLTNPSGVLGANSHVTVNAVNHYTIAPASASLQAGKTLLAPGGLNQSVNNGEFRFALCQVTPAPIGPESGPNAESCTGVSEASNDGNGLVTFPQLTYDAPGTYRYQIREVKGDALDMTYDPTVYTATVNVTDDGEGKLVAKVTYTNTSTGDPVTPGSDPGAMGVPVFVNRTTVANRLPVTGGSDIVIASVILALVLAGGLFVFLRRNREE